MANLLKELELNGFKSFAQKTVFDFSHGITAIVGPNGSGKSNVIDAIRWLLGEREAKNLRGVKSEDLIFAGTAKRPRLGQAQASLRFENKDNFFPVDVAEVAVSRRVNRDGTNEYSLNKSEIRLKDLVDFFAQARLGTKGLIVVSQGNSDIFIQSVPAGRREMIEEMLGLREYQIKRTEAERRLKNTAVNIDKVRALVEEILPHLRSLKRQTNRWEKRDALAAELRALENEFFGREWAEFSAKAAKIASEVATRREHLETLQAARIETERHLHEVEAAQPEERKEIETIKRETQALLERRSALQKEIGRLEARIEMAASSPEQPSGSAPDATALHELVRRIRAKLQNASDLASAVREVIAEIDRLLAEPATPSAPAPIAPDLREDFVKINVDLAGLETQIAELKEKESVLEKNQEQFYHAFKAAVAGHEAAKDKIEKWEAGTQQLAFEGERLKLHEDEWRHQAEAAGREAEELKNFSPQAEYFDRGEAERRIFRLRGELAAIGEVDEALLKEAKETETRYEFLQKESSDLEKAKNDLRKLIADLNEKISTEFGSALTKINTEFDKFFGLMFGGGTARLRLERPKPKAVAAPEEGEGAPSPEAMKDAVRMEDEEEESENDEGIEIDVKLPQKRITSLDMLSGGERSLVGIAALFALISVSPPPFLVLDEVDAALDERNARRFSEMLKDFSKKTQFILVTHNRATMEAADMLYGITLNEDGTSKAVSLKFDAEKTP